MTASTLRIDKPVTLAASPARVQSGNLANHVCGPA
jgi:hypothetical protein